MVGVVEGNVGCGDGVRDGVTVGVAVLVPVGDGEEVGEGTTDPVGVGDTTSAVKNAAWGMEHESVPFVNVI